MSRFSWEIKFIRKKIKLYLSNLSNRIVMFSFPKRKKKFNPANIKSILIARNDKIGDMIVTTSLIKNLAQSCYDVYGSSQKSSL